MITYIILFFIFFITAFSLEIIRFKRIVNYHEFAAFVLVLILILLAAFRFGTGSDYFSYESIWQGIRPMDFNNIWDTSYETLEPGFRLLISALKLYTDNDRVFYFVMSFLAILPIWLGLRKISPNYIIFGLFIYYMIFYVPYVFNGMRQAIAMGLFIYSIKYIRNRNFLKVLLISIFAISFHFSGVIILISYLAYQIKIKPVTFFLTGISMSAIASKIVSIAYIFQIFNFNLYYLEEINVSTSIFQLLTRIAIAVLMLATYYLFFVKKSKFNNEIVFLGRLINIYLIGLFVYIYFKDLNVFATRINMFFRVLEILIFPIILNNLSNKSNRGLVFILVFFLGIYIFSISILTPENLYNYYFIR